MMEWLTYSDSLAIAVGEPMEPAAASAMLAKIEEQLAAMTQALCDSQERAIADLYGIPVEMVAEFINRVMAREAEIFGL